MSIQLTAFIIFYLFTGIMISIQNSRMEDELGFEEELKTTEFQKYFIVPVFWFLLLVYDLFFAREDE